jgi:hypothetical protein
MSLINLPVSIGEGLDKLSILKIKSENITEQSKLIHINNEINMITSILKPYLQDPETCILYNYLVIVNKNIWNLVDISRKNGTTDPIVMKENDARFRIKNKINKHTCSTIQEQKNNPFTLRTFNIYTLADLEDVYNSFVYYDFIHINTPLYHEIHKIFVNHIGITVCGI